MDTDKKKSPRQAKAINVELSTPANDVKDRTCSVCSKAFEEGGFGCAYMRSHKSANSTANAKISIRKKLNTNLKKEPIKMYACHICSKKYTSEIYMKAHIRRFHNRKCSKCSKTLSSSFKMKEHLRICLGKVDSKETESTKTPELHPWGDKKNSTCPVCSKEFDRPNKMKRHWRFHHNKVVDMSTRTCPVCSKAFKYPHKMERHRRMHDRDDTAKRTCPFCNKTFSYVSRMTAHKKTQHIIPAKEPVGVRTCDICLKVFKSVAYKNNHVKLQHTNESETNELEYRKCAICYKEFVQQEGLRHHMVKRHAGEMPFSCTGCMKNFKCLKEFERHANDKIFDCKYGEHVSKLQEYKDTIIKGQYKLFIDKPEIYRKCAVCYTTYVHTKSLKVHMLQHHKRAKPFVCSCKKSFNLYQDFENHVKESAKCDNDKQEAKLRVFKKAIENGVHDKKKKKQ